MSGKIQPNVTNYVDTQLIECSRLQSLEYSDDTTGKSKAIFTNRQSQGIQLNEGDTISLKSAFVSEVGAGGEVIEFTGKENGDTYTVEYTNVEKTSAIDLPTLYDNATFFNPYLIDTEYPIPHLTVGYRTHRVFSSSNVTETFNIKDNEINFSVSYYKTTNGEGYFHLPRRYGNGVRADQIYQLYEFNSSDNYNQLDTAMMSYQTRSWYPYTGASQINLVDSGQIGYGTSDYEIQRRCPADFHLQPFVFEERTNTAPTFYAKKNDNSK